MVAKSPDIPKVSAQYRGGSSALSQLLHEDGSLSGRERNVFYVNLGNGQFFDVSGAVGLDFPEDGRALSLLDFDNDGDLDLLLKSRNAPQLRLLRNDTPTRNYSIAFRLQGRESNRDAIGALIELETPQGQRVKQVQAGSGFLSQSSRRVYFGLGTSTGPLRALVTWPSGRQQTLEALPADHLVTVVEGDTHLQTTRFRPRHFDLSSCSAQEPLKPSVRPEGYAFEDRVPTPPFALPNVAGQTVTAGSLRGRPVLLNFWATWCAPCQEEMRQWKEHYAELHALGVEIVAISVDEPYDHAKVEQFVRERRLPFPVLLANRETLIRYDIFYRSLFTRSTGLQIPTSFLLDANGELVVIYRGITPLKRLLADLRTLREEPATRVQLDLPYRGWRFAGQFTRNYDALGVSFIQHGFLTDAALYFEEAVEERPEDSLAWDFLGKIYGEQGQLERARQAFERSLELSPGRPTAYTGLGKVYMLLNQPEKAEEVLAHAANTAPEDPAVLRRYATALTTNGKWEAAKGVFKDYLKLEPGDAEAHNLLGSLYARTRSFLRALESFVKAIELKPDYAEAWRNLGAAYLQARMPTQAVRPLERATELNPEDADAFYMLAFAYVRIERTEEARQALEKVLELQPSDSRARTALEHLLRSPRSDPP